MNRKFDDWIGRRVWLIGASAGIGAATARLLLDQGAHVALSARRQEILEQMCVGEAQALSVPLDIVDHASVLRARERILKQWPRIDLVLIVAGGYGAMSSDSFDLREANRLLDLNLRGVYHCLDAVLPVLLRQGAGGIGIVASVAGYGGLPKALAYGPAKAALINLSEALYLDLAPRGIDVYQINPGCVDTAPTAQNDSTKPTLMSAEQAAWKLIRGIERGQFHIHFPRRFSNVLRLMRLLPYRLYFWCVHKAAGL
ncbi:MAG: SDR family NAD(P)-dependent oxidoreductase [Pseudomonadota bacterium]